MHFLNKLHTTINKICVLYLYTCILLCCLYTIKHIDRYIINNFERFNNHDHE